MLGIKGNFTADLGSEVIFMETYGEIYKEIKEKRQFIKEQFEQEEARFSNTLERGLKEFDEKLQDKIYEHPGLLGKVIFDSFSTYGFPPELSFEEIEKRGISLGTSEKEEAQKILGIETNDIPELLKKMKKAGCHQIRMGLESANLGILKNIKKGVAPEQIRKAAAMIKKEGMKIVLFLLLGLPGETKETMQETIQFAKSINIDYVTLGIAQPFVGTPFYKYLTDNGYLRTREWNKYDPTELPVYDYPNLSAQEILDAHRNGLLSFYLRPSYILKQILQIRSLSDIRNNFNGFLGFFTRYILPNKKSK